MRKASTRLPEQGTQTPSPAPDLIPAEPKNQPRTHIAIGPANGGTSTEFLDGRFVFPNTETRLFASEVLHGQQISRANGCPGLDRRFLGLRTNSSHATQYFKR